MTPFEEAGYTEDDVFEITIHAGNFRSKENVRLLMDDGSTCPRFSSLDRAAVGYQRLDNLRRIESKAVTPAPLTPHQTTDELVTENLSLEEQIVTLKAKVARKEAFYKNNAATIKSRVTPAISRF